MNFSDRLANGWKLAKSSFKILRANKELLIFPFIGKINTGIISSVQTIFVSAVYHNITNGDVTEHFNQQLVDDLFVRK